MPTIKVKNLKNEEVGEIEGLSFMSKASVIGVSDPTSLASLAGLKTGDVITKV